MGGGWVTQGPVMVPTVCPLISSQPNHLPRRQGNEQVLGQVTQEETEAYGHDAFPKIPHDKYVGQGWGYQEFGLDPFPWKSKQTAPPIRYPPTPPHL